MTLDEVERLGAGLFKQPPACWSEIVRQMVTVKYPWRTTPIGQSFVSDEPINRVLSAYRDYHKRHPVRYMIRAETVDGRAMTCCERIA